MFLEVAIREFFIKSILTGILKWIFIFFAVTVLAFTITRAIPVSPVQVLLTSYQLPASKENIEYLEKQWGLDKPITIQYLKWLRQLAQGNLGTSILTKQDIKTEMIRRIPFSFAIGFGGLLIAAVISFYLGYKAALKDNGFYDILTSSLAVINQTVPIFILAVILIYFIGVKYKLIKFFNGSGNIKILIAMSIIAINNIGAISRIVKTHFKLILKEPYFIFAVSRGFSPKQALLKEGFKPALIGLISAIISKFAWVVGGSAAIEFVFAIPGISFFLIESITRRDYNVIQSYILIIALWLLFVHIFFELILKLLDKRIK